jgi:ribokinase
MGMVEVVVIGSYCHDVGLRVESFPSPGETVFGSDILESHGGKGSNQAINVRRAGHSVAFVCAIGDDAKGHGAVDLWRSEDLDTSLTLIKSEGATGMALIVIAASG